MAGLMLRNMRHAVVIFGVMLSFLVVGGRRSPSRPRSSPSAATEGLPVAAGPNMEGKEVRLGPVASAPPGRR